MVEAPLYKIENIQYDNLIPFSGPGGRRFKSSLPDQFSLVNMRVPGRLGNLAALAAFGCATSLLPHG